MLGAPRFVGSDPTHSPPIPRFAPAEKVSRVALLYGRYLGINGSFFEYKVLALQGFTILLQVNAPLIPLSLTCGDARARRGAAYNC